MSIEFTCTCGQPLKAPEGMVGGKARCPACKRILSVPGAGEAADTAPDDEIRLAPADVPPVPEPSAAAAGSYNGPTTASICPHCRAEVSIPAGRPGESVHCPRCNGEFLAPAQAPVWPGGYPPPYAPPPTVYGPGAYRPPQAAPGAVASLVCGILSVISACFGVAMGFITCVGLVLALVAIVQGNGARQQAQRSPYVSGGMGVAGFVLGIIGMVLQTLIFIIRITVSGQLF